MRTEPSALNVAYEQLKITAKKLNLDPGMHEILKQPKRSLIVSIGIMDTYSQLKGYRIPESVTGKPLMSGGSEGREEATSLGVLICARELAKDVNLKLKGATIAIQGYGNVGWNVAKIAYNWGCKIVAVSDSRGGIYCPNGLNPYRIHKHKVKTGSVRTAKGCENITNEELFEIKCDILIPAALENQIK